jgi:hypothetical protein
VTAKVLDTWLHADLQTSSSTPLCEASSTQQSLSPSVLMNGITSLTITVDPDDNSDVKLVMVSLDSIITRLPSLVYLAIQGGSVDETFRDYVIAHRASTPRLVIELQPDWRPPTML